MQASSSMSTDMSLDDFSFLSPRTPSSEDIIVVAPWQEFEHQGPQKRGLAKILNLHGGSSSDLSRTRNSEDSTESHKKYNILGRVKHSFSKPNLKKLSQDQQLSQQSNEIDFASSLYLSPSSIPRAPSPIPHKKSMKFGKQKPQIPLAPPLPPRPEEYGRPFPEMSMDKIKNVPLHDIVKDYVPGDRRHELSNSETTSCPSFEQSSDDFPPFIDPFQPTLQQVLCERFPGSNPYLSEPLRTKLGSSGSTTTPAETASWAAPQSWAVGAVEESAPPDHPSSDEECDQDISEGSNEPPVVIFQGRSASSASRDPLLPDRRKPSSNLANERSASRKDSRKDSIRDKADRPQGPPVSFVLLTIEIHISH